MSTNQPVTPNDMNPGDDAGAEFVGAGAGDTVCPECDGHGVLKDKTECTNCGGTGRIAQAEGGA
jgi:RecJ-like exonuclease